MAIEIMREKHLVISEDEYLDAIIDNLSDETVERLNKHRHDEDESIPFKPIA